MRRLLRPRWIASHLLVLGLVVVMVNLGFWQLRRLDERRDRNELVASRLALPPVPVEDLVAAGDGAEVTDDIRFRPVTATGRYDGPTTAVRTTQDGATGAWVLSTLELDTGGVVAVLRGFAALAPDGSVPEPGPPSGATIIEGVAVPVPRLPHTAETGFDRLTDGIADVLPVVVQAQAADVEADLTPVPTPDLGEGPHLGYAVQWFLFSAVGVVGYPILLRRRLRDDTG